MTFEHFTPDDGLSSYYVNVIFQNSEGFIWISTLTWGAFIFKNLIPVTIGNIIGGAVFVGLGYWGAYLRPSK